MVAAVKKAQGEYNVKVGVFDDSARPDSDYTNAQIAAVMTFGTEDGVVPARPFIQPAFDENQEALTSMAKRLFVGVLDGRVLMVSTLNMMGAWLANKTKNYVTQGAPIPPPNAPSVAARKQSKGLGRIRTLIDTAAMVGAITWQVVKAAARSRRK